MPKLFYRSHFATRWFFSPQFRVPLCRNDTVRPVRCSFCQKSQKTVDSLISSQSGKRHGVYICNECVGVCQQILEEVCGEREAIKAPDRKYSGQVLRCSFCRKTYEEVEKLISAPREYPPAYICNDCVNASGGILEDGGRDGVSAVRRVPQPVAPPPVGSSQVWVVRLAWIVILAIVGLVLLAVLGRQ